MSTVLDSLVRWFFTLYSAIFHTHARRMRFTLCIHVCVRVCVSLCVWAIFFVVRLFVWWPLRTAKKTMHNFVLCLFFVAGLMSFFFFLSYCDRIFVRLRLFVCAMIIPHFVCCQPKHTLHYNAWHVLYKIVYAVCIEMFVCLCIDCDVDMGLASRLAIFSTFDHCTFWWDNIFHVEP